MRPFPSVPETDEEWLSREPIMWGLDWQLLRDFRDDRAFYSLTQDAVTRSSKKRLHVRKDAGGNGN